nr:hypothetical protein GCM10020092_094910 [Actinoplanes digitatis]
MLAYCTALGLAEGHLVYATGAPRREYRLVGSGVRVVTHGLNLAAPLPEVKKPGRGDRGSAGRRRLSRGQRRCENAGMEDVRTTSEDDIRAGGAMSRRLFFGRALGLAGAAGALLALTGCPGGDGDDDDGDDEDDD